MKDSSLRALATVQQDPVYHPEGDVLAHTLQVWGAARRIAAREGLHGAARKTLLWAALLHDYGKLHHTQVAEGGRVTNHGHAEASADLAWALLFRYGVGWQCWAGVVVLCAQHMNARDLDRYSARGLRRLDRKLAEAGVDRALLLLLVEADRAGRVA
jgi:tRNA nucleotidyltransferase (CCA-adding enzyme)